MPARFMVPQFIEVEAKIFGPVTARQFIMLLVGAGICFLEYKVFDFTLFLISGIITVLITVIFAFIRVNGQPFHYFLLNFLQTLRRPKIKVWKKSYTPKDIALYREMETYKKESAPAIKKESLGFSRLSELSLIVNTGGAYEGEDGENNNGSF